MKHPIPYTLVEEDDTPPYPDLYAVTTNGLWDLFALIGIIASFAFVGGWLWAR
jgi:hypothetical protein